jgi:tetratricopeptide (TPR) repeat protein
MNYLFEAVGWEDSLPGFGRAQEIINRDVEQCDVFVMLLWKRWGQPTGKFSSGTEEEFNIARERYNRTKNSPHLLLYFRSVPRSMMADPGEQLSKVIKFRTWVEEERLCMFDTYDKPQDWKDLLVRHLCKWLDTKVSGGQRATKFIRKTVHVSAEGEERLREMQRELEEKNAQLHKTQSKLRAVAVTYAVEAMKQIDRGKITAAEENFAKSVELYEEPEVLNNYGHFLFQIGSLDRAKEIFEKLYNITSIDEAMHRANACVGLGRVYETSGDMEQAEEMYQKALRNSFVLSVDERINVYGKLGNILLTKGDLQAAEAIYKKSLELHAIYNTEDSEDTLADNYAVPSNVDAEHAAANSYVGLGNVSMARGDLTEAEKLFGKALEIYTRLNSKQNTAGIFSTLGIIYSRQDDVSKAKKVWTRAIKLYGELKNDEEVERNQARLAALKIKGPRTAAKRGHRNPRPASGK